MEKGGYVQPRELFEFVVRCVTSAGAEQSGAESLASVLVEADLRGHYSHGLNRLPFYLQDLRTGKCREAGKPQIVAQTTATAHVDGCNLLGPVVGRFSMRVAMEKARTSGIGLVVARNSNHFGIAGWYSTMASEEGLIGMAFTNASPTTAVTRCKEPVIGTNPLSFAAPAGHKDDFVLDMACSTVALGKLEILERKKLPMPGKWGIDKDGNPTTNPTDVLQGGALLPLGGFEETGGYKGYGLAMMVDILCGVLGGAKFGLQLKPWLNTDEPANLAQCFIAINPSAFAPGFEDRMKELLSGYRNLPAENPNEKVLTPGDPERINKKECEKVGGIFYHEKQLELLLKIAEEMSIPPFSIRF
ncbi:hypothetical protein LAZ67_19002530 [Cordylochernes scorpioides]|uniref:Malate dehydrogenase n=1 Tax=Cordylochernes scorpioides TaxID=51811 RepID=A0ABY6LIK4_9ARAC|nr:hypothetical protein LAZ67_19002530 [Cordylochernes scorpioides]